MTKKLQKFSTKVTLHAEKRVSLDEVTSALVSLNCISSRKYELDRYFVLRDQDNKVYTEIYLEASYTARGANLSDVRRFNSKHLSNFSEVYYNGNSTKVLETK